MADSVCALVPVYDNPATIVQVVEGLRKYFQQIIIIDDGSDIQTQVLINSLSEQQPGHIFSRRLPTNRGKGAAVKSGLQLARELGFSHALQVDADGQHDLNDIPKFLECMHVSPRAMVLGSPVFGTDIPPLRKHGRKLTRLMVAIEAGTTGLPDAMCGFRIYPVAAVVALRTMCSRMCYDPEILVRAHWAGIPITSIPTRVRYLTAEEGGVSHFRGLHDNILNVCLHTCLLLQAPVRWVLRLAVAPRQ